MGWDDNPGILGLSELLWGGMTILEYWDCHSYYGVQGYSDIEDMERYDNPGILGLSQLLWCTGIL